MNVAHVAMMRRLRIPPVFAHRLRQLFQCGDFLPAVAAIIAAKQSHRFDAGVNDFVVRRIDRHRANVAVEHFNPALAAISRSIKSVVSNADENYFRRLLAAVDRIDDAVVKMTRDFLPTAIRSSAR